MKYCTGIVLILLAVATASLNTTKEKSVCVPRHCMDLYKSGHTCSGIYTIKPDHLPAFQVYCDMETDGGGWTVFQRRMDGTVNFERNWADYLKGFGDLDGEFWLGLNKIHRLTNINVTLRIDLQDFEQNKRFAKYSVFDVKDADTIYSLLVGGYSGNAGDSMGYHNGRKFSTRDQDNDESSSNNCASTYHGAWWYRSCHHSNLNGYYAYAGSHNSAQYGIYWHHWKGNLYSLKFTEMKVKRSPRII